MNTLTINNVSLKRSLYQHFLILPKHEAKHEREWKIKTETQHTPPLGGWIVSFVMEFYMKYKIVNLKVPVPVDKYDKEYTEEERKMHFKDFTYLLALELMFKLNAFQPRTLQRIFQRMASSMDEWANKTAKKPLCRKHIHKQWLKEVEFEEKKDAHLGTVTEIEVYKRGQRNTERG